MTQSEFITRADAYITQLLVGLCLHPFEIGCQTLPWGVRFVVRLDQREYDDIRYSDLYPALQKLVAGLAARRLGASDSSFRAELKLYDPYFAGLSYRSIDTSSDAW
ncbi:MAG: hypothetical protein Tsb0020_44680 [Haliangiales bacterium]